MSIEKVLIVDDELLVRNFLAEAFRRKNIEVVAVESGQKAINLLKDNVFDMVITDMKLNDITGIEVIRKGKALAPQTLFVVVTAYASVENAVEAMRLGAFDYLTKPFCPDTIEALIEKGRNRASLVAENQYLRQQILPVDAKQIQKVIGESPIMKHILDDAIRIAQSQASVLITGESGTGKEVIAHAIHYNSPRANSPFIKVNCAAVPDTLIESEFFGHEKGAFTGANAKRIGRFELANTGTLLLDEITEIPASLQAKLLRAVQEQEFERVGGTKPVKVDVRLISTSNRDLKEAVANQTFREDLYYRLNVVPIHLPPLRERPEDIIPLANYFLEKLSSGNRKEKKTLSPASQKKLLAYPWPGNVRELSNIIERAYVMAASNVIEPNHLYLEPASTTEAKTSFPIGTTLEDLEKRLIIETFHAQKNDRAKTAQMLGISARKLASKLSELGLKD